MPQTFLSIRGIDPLLFRDGRPFTADAGGLTASSLPLPMPPTVAAFVRTQIGHAEGWQWTHDECREAHGIPVHGPLLRRNGEVVLPAPKDALLRPIPGDADHALPQRLAPREPEDSASAEQGDCDLPGGLWPVMPLLSTQRAEVTSPYENAEPPRGFNYWTRADMLDWLEHSDTIDKARGIGRISGLPEEERIGIAIGPDGKATDGMLYATRLRAFAERGDDGRHAGCSDQIHQAGTAFDHKLVEYSLIARVNLPSGRRCLGGGALGGERRLTVFEPIDDTAEIWPRCPQSLKDRLSVATRVRMILATPAYFEHGWRPDWIDKSGSGKAHLPAGIAKVRLKLVGAAVDRRVPVSGWGLREGEQGPRPIRWLAPSGSVYFFVVEGGDPSALWRDAWMEPMSDEEQNRRDGLGLALWGTW